MPALWVSVLCGVAALLGCGVLFHHADVSVAAQVISLAQSIVAGAFGAAAGHAAASTKITGGPVTVNNQPDSSAGEVPVNPSQPTAAQ